MRACVLSISTRVHMRHNIQQQQTNAINALTGSTSHTAERRNRLSRGRTARRRSPVAPKLHAYAHTLGDRISIATLRLGHTHKHYNRRSVALTPAGCARGVRCTVASHRPLPPPPVPPQPPRRRSAAQRAARSRRARPLAARTRRAESTFGAPSCAAEQPDADPHHARALTLTRPPNINTHTQRSRQATVRLVPRYPPEKPTRKQNPNSQQQPTLLRLDSNRDRVTTVRAPFAQ